MKRGRLFVITAPSGAGKTSLVDALLQTEPNLRLSISHTTRPRRPTETDGREYHFVTQGQFEQLIAQGQFLEHARVFDNFYGTARAFVEEQLRRGARRAAGDRLARCPAGARRAARLRKHLHPASLAARARRTPANRATDAPEVIARRLRDAAADMSHYREFDYVVVNDDFAHALAELRRIIAGEGAELTADRPQLKRLLAELLAAP